MAYNSPRYRRVFIQQQTGGTFRTINNTAGTWSSTGAKLLRIPENALTITPNLPKTQVPWLTGTRSRQNDILGRKSASWSINNLMLIPSGSAGTVPDTDVLWQAVFGQTAAISGGVSATYNFLDTGYLPFTLLDFPHGSTTLSSRTVWGCIPTDVTFTLNGNIFQGSINGQGGYVLDSDNFTNEDTTAKAGLTAYPLEPSSPTTVGAVIPGFGGTASLDGGACETKIESMQIRIQTGFRLIGDVFSDGYPIAIVGGMRTVSITLGFLDDDSAALQDLKQKAKTNAPMAMTVTVGTTAGSKCQFVLGNVQLVPYAFNDQSDVVQANFPESMAHASAIGNVDELSLVWL